MTTTEMPSVMMDLTYKQIARIIGVEGNAQAAQVLVRTRGWGKSPGSGREVIVHTPADELEAERRQRLGAPDGTAPMVIASITPTVGEPMPVDVGIPSDVYLRMSVAAAMRAIESGQYISPIDEAVEALDRMLLPL